MPSWGLVIHLWNQGKGTVWSIPHWFEWHSLFCVGDSILSFPSLVPAGLWYRTAWKMSVLWELFHKKWSSPLSWRLGSQNSTQDHPSGHVLFSWDERFWNAIYCKTHSGHSASTVNDIPFITTQMRTENDIGKQWTPQKGRESHYIQHASYFIIRAHSQRRHHQMSLL